MACEAVAGGFFGKADFGWAPSLTGLFSWAQAGHGDCDCSPQDRAQGPRLRPECTVGALCCCSGQELAAGDRARPHSSSAIGMLGRGPCTGLWLDLRRTVTAEPVLSDTPCPCVSPCGCSAPGVGLWLLPRGGNEGEQVPLQKRGLQHRQVLHHA